MTTSPDEFLSGLAADGFAATPVEFAPGTAFGDHAHDFASRILITDGELTITSNGVEWTLITGDVYELAENEVHSEIVGRDGVRYLSARPIRTSDDSPDRPRRSDLSRAD